jgi:hypothetical protein
MARHHRLFRPPGAHRTYSGSGVATEGQHTRGPDAGINPFPPPEIRRFSGLRSKPAIQLGRAARPLPALLLRRRPPPCMWGAVSRHAPSPRRPRPSWPAGPSSGGSRRPAACEGQTTHWPWAARAARAAPGRLWGYQTLNPVSRTLPRGRRGSAGLHFSGPGEPVRQVLRTLEPRGARVR